MARSVPSTRGPTTEPRLPPLSSARASGRGEDSDDDPSPPRNPPHDRDSPRPGAWMGRVGGLGRAGGRSPGWRRQTSPRCPSGSGPAPWARCASRRPGGVFFWRGRARVVSHGWRQKLGPGLRPIMHDDPPPLEMCSTAATLRDRKPGSWLQGRVGDPGGRGCGPPGCRRRASPCRRPPAPERPGPGLPPVIGPGAFWPRVRS